MDSTEGRDEPGADSLDQLRTALNDELVVLQTQVGRLEQLLDTRRARRPARRAGPRLVHAAERACGERDRST